MIEEAATDITRYWTRSQLPDTDKQKILEMVKEYYETKNEHIHDQYFAGLTARTIEKHVPQTGFEK